MNNTDGNAIYQLISIVLYRNNSFMWAQTFIFHSCSCTKKSPLLFMDQSTLHRPPCPHSYMQVSLPGDLKQGGGGYFFLSKVAVQLVQPTKQSVSTLQMFCLLNPQTNACEPNPKTTSSDFNS